MLLFNSECGECIYRSSVSVASAVSVRICPLRNERDSAMAKMANKLTKEGDLFLGQKIIEVRRVGAAQEVWYKLGTLRIL